MEIHHEPSQAAWQEFLRRQCARTPLEATVTAVVPFGCFVRLHDGVDGLVHISEMPDQPEAGDVVSGRSEPMRGTRPRCPGPR